MIKNVKELLAELLQGTELQRVDFKRAQCRLDNEALKLRFVRDILRIEGTEGPSYYILLDVKTGRNGSPGEAVSVPDHYDGSDLEPIANCLIDDSIQFEYYPLMYQGNECALLHIPTSKAEPRWPQTDHGTRCSGALSVSIRHSSIDGEGLFALSPFRPGDAICESQGYIVSPTTRCLEPWESRTSYQLSSDFHFVPTSILGATINGLAKVNHACDPNSYVQFDPQTRRLVLKALRNMSDGEEITCDYRATETELVHPFICRCRTDSCRRFIHGARFEL